MKNLNKGFAGIGIIIAIVLAFVVVGGVGYYLVSQNNSGQRQLEEDAETETQKENTNENTEETPNNLQKTHTDSAKATYTNNKYSFSFEYPKSLIFDSDYSGTCNTSKPEDKNLTIKKDTVIPITFEPAEIEGAGIIGAVQYQLHKDCFAVQLALVLVAKKQKNTLDEYLNSLIKTSNNVKRKTADINNSTVQMLSWKNSQIVGYTADEYYFERGDYMYSISHLYPQAMLDTPLGDREAKYKEEWRDYNLGLDIIKTFHLTTPSISTTISSPYIGAKNWPPFVRNSPEPYSCIPAHSDTESRAEKIINGKTYCISSAIEGSAGRRDGEYLYATANGTGTKTTYFNLGWVSCGGYGTTGEPKYDQCEADQAKVFSNLDLMVDSVF